MSFGTFLYGQPLGPERFRLVQLESGSISRVELRCRLIIKSVSSQASYLALSYQWGDKNDIEPILCNGTELWISRNLAAALRILQNSGLRSELTWINQICINQGLPEERSQQVELMHAIFCNATRTIIWLGGCHDLMAVMAFKVVRRINNIVAKERANPESLFTTTFSQEIVTQEINIKRGLPVFDPGNLEWQCLTILLYQS